jgi:hypothetical protein
MCLLFFVILVGVGNECVGVLESEGAGCWMLDAGRVVGDS